MPATRRIVVWMSALALTLAACTAPAPTPAAPTTAPAAKPAGQAAAPPTGAPIKVGVLDDVTGIGAIEGALMRISVELVVQETNTSGGINGHPLQVVYADPKGDATQALQLATQLAQQDNVDALAGGIFSPECLGVQGLAEKLQLVYVAVNGCASDVYTAKSCNKYSFRVYPAGRQTSDPAFTYEVKTFGTKWGIIYPDYALGQSQLATSEAALQKNGAEYVTKVAVPLGETNVTPYVTKVPTDGSVTALYITMTGSDLARVMNVIQQFGLNKKMAIVTGLGKESFGGVYPDALNGAIITGTRPSDGVPGNKLDEDYMRAWLDMAKKNSDLLGPLGGIDKATPGNNNGYNAYMSMKSLVLAMRKASFNGKADTDKLVSAFETLNVPQSAEGFPSGQMIMNKDDHQGRTTYYLLKINGQKEEVVQTFAPDSLPLIGDCKIAS
ncbi:MAG TPA: ABC transporter substrate-binding protein [Chloroflexota bacterium]|jgi:branched-chain amino acid transport system substrate-binding protein